MLSLSTRFIQLFLQYKDRPSFSAVFSEIEEMGYVAEEKYYSPLKIELSDGKHWQSCSVFLEYNANIVKYVFVL